MLKRFAPLDRAEDPVRVEREESLSHRNILYFISEEFSLKLFWFWFSLGLCSLFYWNSRPSLEFISSFIFMLKFKFGIFKISQYLLRQLSMTHCSTINNIEVLFIKISIYLHLAFNTKLNIPLCYYNGENNTDLRIGC